jgi:hypothetical protein
MVLEAYEPWLSQVGNLWSVASFDNGTAVISVSAGSVVVLGSKVDTASNDPTILEQAFGRGGDAVDGTYQFSLYDSLYFASGGSLVISGGEVTAINGTYVNYDKVDAEGEPECPLIYQWGFDFVATSIDAFAEGVEFTDSFADGGEITWTVTFTIDDSLGFTSFLDVGGGHRALAGRHDDFRKSAKGATTAELRSTSRDHRSRSLLNLNRNAPQTPYHTRRPGHPGGRKAAVPLSVSESNKF